MPISNRPNIEAFINKGGSSTANEEKKAAPRPRKPPKTEQEPRPTQTVVGPPQPKAAKTSAAVNIQPKPGKALGRPRKVRQPDEADTLKFVMRIPPAISEELNRVVEGRKIPMSRNVWILEAIVERLDREK